jgi:hypothetical protein
MSRNSAGLQRAEVATQDVQTKRTGIYCAANIMLASLWPTRHAIINYQLSTVNYSFYSLRVTPLSITNYQLAIIPSMAYALRHYQLPIIN